MGRGKRILGTGLVAGLSSMALAAGAHATPYYATPVPTPGATCVETDPCALADAVAAATIAGDEVLLDAGTYTLTTDLSMTPVPATMSPKVPGTFPTITNAAGYQISADSWTLTDLTITATGLGVGETVLDFDDGRGDRLSITSDGASSYGVVLDGNSAISDSTVWAKGNAAVAFLKSDLSPPSAATIRNVTAIAPHATGRALLTGSAFGQPQTVTVQNSILRAGGTDITALGNVPNGINVNLDRSNYVEGLENPPDGNLNDLGGHQNAAPLFLNEATGLFYELPGSPTVDAGAVVTGLSALDYEREPRCMGLAPDIGADELTGPPCPTPSTPITTPTTTPAPGRGKKKCKKKKKRSGAAAKKKKCKKKRRR